MARLLLSTAEGLGVRFLFNTSVDEITTGRPSNVHAVALGPQNSV